MIPDNDFKTLTMAKVYAGQGHYEKAAEIYKHLLKYEPDSPDLARALAGVEKKLHQKTRVDSEQLGELFSTWVDLMLRHKKMRYLRKIKGTLKG